MLNALGRSQFAWKPRAVLAVLVGLVGALVLAVPAHAATYSPLGSTRLYGGTSANGSYVAFVTNAKLLPSDTNSLDDLYVLTVSSGAIRLASANNSGRAVGVGPDTKGSLDGTNFVSDNGRYVIFTSTAAVVSGVPAGREHLYRRDLSSNTSVLVDKTSTGAAGSTEVGAVGGMSATGSRIVFVTASRLTTADTDSYADTYMWSSGTVSLLSTSGGSSNDARISADGSHVIYAAVAPAPGVGWNLYKRTISGGAITRIAANIQLYGFAISADGNRTAFTTTASYTSADSSGVDVYVHTASNSTYAWVTRPAPGTTPPSGRLFTVGTMSANGSRLALTTNIRLASGANSTGRSVYRVNVTAGTATVVLPGGGRTSTLGYSVAITAGGTGMIFDSGTSLWRVTGL